MSSTDLDTDVAKQEPEPTEPGPILDEVSPGPNKGPLELPQEFADEVPSSEKPPEPNEPGLDQPAETEGGGAEEVDAQSIIPTPTESNIINVEVDPSTDSVHNSLLSYNFDNMLSSATKREQSQEDIFDTFAQGTMLDDEPFQLAFIEYAEEEQEEEEPEVPIKKKRKKKKKPSVGDIPGEVQGESSVMFPRIDEKDEEKIDDELEDEEETEHETEGEEEEETKEKLSEEERKEYYDLYDSLDRQLSEEKEKNYVLLKKLVQYYQQKRMFHVLQEDKVPPDTIRKYEMQLEDYDNFVELSSREQKSLQADVSNLRRKCALKTKEVEECFTKLQRSEMELGKEILAAETGLKCDEKVIERHLKRQKIQLNNLQKIRYNYIKLRNKVTQTQEALDALDNLGSDFHLIDYEQLKLDNRNLKDKLEEKELELTKMRAKCENAVQTLAHLREKTHALTKVVDFLNSRLDSVGGEYEDVREQVNVLKKERDIFRMHIDKMKRDAGLLSKTRLLQDMSQTIEEKDVLLEKIEVAKRELKNTAMKVEKIRRNLNSPSKLKVIRKKMQKMADDEAKEKSPPSSITMDSDGYKIYSEDNISINL